MYCTAQVQVSHCDISAFEKESSEILEGLKGVAPFAFFTNWRWRRCRIEYCCCSFSFSRRGVWGNIYIRGGAYLGLDESRASPKCEEGDLCHGKAERAVASLLGEAGNLCLR